MCRIGTVLGVLLVLLLAGTSAAVMPHVPYFSQCDSRWGSDKLGGDGPTICDAGCALTSAAMVMAYYDYGVDTDPEKLNDAIGRLGYADQSVAFGEPDDLPVIGDGDGEDNIGRYRPGDTTGVF